MQMKIEEANRRHSVSRIMDHSGTQRRLIMAALRLAHRVLGIRRKRLGFGVPGLGTARLVGASVAIAGFGLATLATAQEIVSPSGDEVLLFATLVDASRQQAQADAVPSTAVAVGTGAAATTAEAVAIGTNVTATGGKAVSIGSGNVASGNGAVAIGDPNIVTGTGAVGMGADNTATGNGTVAIGNLNMVGGGGQAVGVAGTAAQGAVGLGYQNTVTGQGAVAMGDRSIANGGSAVALGRQANATGLSAVAIGQTSAASNIYAVAIGGLASATGAESVALGTGAQGSMSMSVAVGSNAAAQANAGDVALGAGSATSAVVNTTGDVIDGVSYTYAGTSAVSTVSVGQAGAERTVTNVAAGRVSATSTDAVNGSQLFATNQAVTDLGSTVTNLGNSTASNLGGGSVYDPATGTVGAPSYTVQGGTYNNVGDALGAADTALTNNTTDIAALQTDALQWNSTLGAYDASHGSGSPQTIANVAAGVNAEDAVNVSQLNQTVDAARTHYYSVNDGGTTGGNYNNDGATGTNAVAVGVNAAAAGVDGTAIGDGATVAAGAARAIAVGTAASASGIGSIAEGVDTVSSGDSAVALGTSAQATQNQALAIGTLAKATGIQSTAIGSGSNASAGDAVAIGQFAAASGVNSSALGASSSATGVTATAIGNGAQASGNNSAALGTSASASQLNSTALGFGATANNINGVALGAGSTTAAVVGTTGTTINGTTYNFAGTTPTSVVSVGNVGAERQITNVAAGRLSATSTDAVNGSQLFATNQAVDSLAADALQWNPTLGAYDASHGSGSPQTIANVAAGVNAEDAVNVSQLNQTVDASKTHYYSVNDGGVPGGNYANNGATGQFALAAGVDATAGGIDATSVGHLATATGAWSVAVGRGATAAYTQGVALGKRAQAMTISSVAIGSDAYAGTNVGDVALGALSYTSAVVNTTGATIDGVAYTYAGTARSTVSVGQIGDERTITNVAAGRVSSSSTDAINGSQLFATNQAIENVAGGLTHYYSVNDGGTVGGNYDNDGATGTNAVAVGVNAAAAGLDGTAIGNGASASGEGAIALGRNTVSSGLDTIAIGTGASATDSVAIGAAASASAGGTALGDGAKATTAGGVALGKNSVEGTAVAVGGTTIAGTAYTFAGAAPTSVVSVGSAGNERQITNVASGQLSATSTDAVNGSQLFATNQAIEAIDTAVGEVGDRAVKYDGNVGDAKDTITLEGTTGTTITNLTAGAVNATSSDAINGSQLYSVSNSIATNLGGGATVNADGTVNGPTYTMQGGSYSTVYDTFAAVDGSLTSINNQLTNINNGAGVKYFHAKSTAADSQAVGQESVAVGPTAVANGNGSVAMGNGATTATGATGAVALGQGAAANNVGDVALGSGSTTQAVVNTTGTTINGNNYTFAGTAATSTVSVGGVGAERTITNVAAGQLSATSTDAVNGSQLFATNQAIDGLAAGIGNLTDGAVLYDKNPDGTKKNSVTLVGGDPNAPVLVSNVKAGVANTDAVNVGQLKDGLSDTLIEANTYTDTRVNYAIDTANTYTDQVAVTTLNEANSYTDYKFGQLNQEIGDVRGEARQAAAIGLAAASLRYDDRPGKLSAAVGGGIWRGEGALAFGAGYTSEDGRLRTNLSATTAGGHWGAGAGLSYTFN